MSYRSINIRPVTAYTAYGESSRLSPGAIVCATLYPLSASVLPVQAYGEIFIAESIPSGLHNVCILASDYFGWHNPLSWQGAVPIGDDHLIEGIVWGPALIDFRLTWWVADKLTAATGFPRDP